MLGKRVSRVHIWDTLERVGLTSAICLCLPPKSKFGSGVVLRKPEAEGCK